MGARTAPRRQPCVYVMRRDDGAVKVGITVSLAYRRYQVERECGQFTEVWSHHPTATIRGAAKVEKLAHEALVLHRINGEWFSVSPEHAVAVVLVSAQQAGPEFLPAPAPRGHEIGFHGDVVRAARMMLDWTMDDLAKRSGVSLASIKNIERGAADPRASTLRAIQEAFEKAGVQMLEPGDVRSGGKGVRFG